METIGFILGGAAGWFGIGYAAGAYFFAYSQREFPSIAASQRYSDKVAAGFLSLLGPLGLACVLLATTAWASTNGRKLSRGFVFGWLWA